jgi:hypothetical protein
MAVIQSVKVGNRVIDLFTFQGEVMDEKKWATTHVSGGGGIGYVHAGSGYSTPRPVTSKTTTHDQFFVRSDDGQERAVETTNADLALRKGHRVTLLLGIEKGKEQGPCVAIYNHTTSDLTLINGDIKQLAFPSNVAGKLFMFLGWVIALWVFLGTATHQGIGFFFISIMAVFGLIRYWRRKKYNATLHGAIDGAILQIKNQK